MHIWLFWFICTIYGVDCHNPSKNNKKKYTTRILLNSTTEETSFTSASATENNNESTASGTGCIRKTTVNRRKSSTCGTAIKNKSHFDKRHNQKATPCDDTAVDNKSYFYEKYDQKETQNGSTAIDNKLYFYEKYDQREIPCGGSAVDNKSYFYKRHNQEKRQNDDKFSGSCVYSNEAELSDDISSNNSSNESDDYGESKNQHSDVDINENGGYEELSNPYLDMNIIKKQIKAQNIPRHMNDEENQYLEPDHGQYQNIFQQKRENVEPEHKQYQNIPRPKRKLLIQTGTDSEINNMDQMIRRIYEVLNEIFSHFYSYENNLRPLGSNWSNCDPFTVIKWRFDVKRFENIINMVYNTFADAAKKKYNPNEKPSNNYRKLLSYSRETYRNMTRSFDINFEFQARLMHYIWLQRKTVKHLGRYINNTIIYSNSSIVFYEMKQRLDLYHNKYGNDYYSLENLGKNKTGSGLFLQRHCMFIKDLKYKLLRAKNEDFPREHCEFKKENLETYLTRLMRTFDRLLDMSYRVEHKKHFLDEYLNGLLYYVGRL